MADVRRIAVVMAAALLLAGCGSVPPLSPPTPFPTFPALPEPSPTVRPVTPTPAKVTALPDSTPTPAGILLPDPPPTSSAPPIGRLAAGGMIDIRQIHMFDSALGWGFGGKPDGDDSVLRTEDGGRTWKDVTPPQPRSEEGVRLAAAGYFADPETAWVVYFDPQVPQDMNLKALIVWRTRDAGATWKASQPVGLEFLGVEFLPPYLRFVDERQGWILANHGPAGMHRYPIYLLETKDGGATWTPHIDPYVGPYLQSCTKSGLAFGGPAVGMATIESCPLEGAVVEWTRDGGRTWETTFLPSPPESPDLLTFSACDVHSPAFFSEVSAVVAAECRVLEGEEVVDVRLAYFTVDGGESWVSRTYPGGRLLFLDERSGWALGRDLYRTTDGGVTWTFVKSVSWDGQFSFVGPLIGWAVARSEGEIGLVKTEDGGATWALLEPIITP